MKSIYKGGTVVYAVIERQSQISEKRPFQRCNVFLLACGSKKSVRKSIIIRIKEKIDEVKP